MTIPFKWKEFSVMQIAFGLDLNKCVGCHSCLIACKNENGLEVKTQWRQVIFFNPQKYPHLPVLSYSMACNHCHNPPCHSNCPANAYEINRITGAVTINQQKCMGCKYCQWVCPYDAPAFRKNLGTMSKCTLCSHLKNDLPACVHACPTGALTLRDYLETPDTKKILPDIFRSNIKPSLIIEPLQNTMKAPKTPCIEKGEWFHHFLGKMTRKHESSLSLQSEWPLLLFTMGFPLMVALFTAHSLKEMIVSPLLYGLLGILCIGFSIVHLGKKQRFFRAILNWKQSWLSREIILCTFFWVGTLYLVLLTIPIPLVYYCFIFIGSLALFAIDQVYLIDNNLFRNRFQSSSTLFIGIYLSTLFVYWIPLFCVIGCFKLVLYLQQKKNTEHINHYLFYRGIRIMLSFVIPAFLLVFMPHFAKYPVIVSIVCGEVLDRMEFYHTIEFMRPQTKAAMDLQELLSPSRSVE